MRARVRASSSIFIWFWIFKRARTVSFTGTLIAN